MVFSLLDDDDDDDDDDDHDDSLMIPSLYIGKWLLYNNHCHPLKELFVWSPKFLYFWWE